MQSDSLCSDALITLLKINLWLKSIENFLRTPLGETCNVLPIADRTTGDCNSHVIYQAKDVV